MEKTEKVNHPDHYGGANNPYETIKVIESMGIGYEFCIGNAVKYIMRAGLKKDSPMEDDLNKAKWYISRAAALAKKSSEAFDAEMQASLIAAGVPEHLAKVHKEPDVSNFKHVPIDAVEYSQ